MRGLTLGLVAAQLLCLPAIMPAQVETAAPVSNAMPTNDFGFNLPTHLGTLSYSLTASESISTEPGYGSVYASTGLSGSLAYLSKSERNPFSLVYSGGVLFSSVPGYGSVEPYQNLAASQVYRTKAWVFVVSDAFSYLPGTPTTGISGVAGVGDINVFPVQTGIEPTENILSNYSSRISNGLEGSATWQATSSLDFAGSGSWQILHFLAGAPGTNTDSVNASFGPNYRIDALNSVGADAYYSRNTFPGFENYLIETEGINVNYNRNWSRRLSTSFSFGPERSHGTTTVHIPTQWNLAGSAGITYATRTTGFYANYVRGVNGGSGIIFGGLSDTVGAGLNRPINRDWNFGLNASYSRTVSLVPIDDSIPRYDSIYGGVQVSRRLTESLSAYGAYTGIWQGNNGQAANSPAAFHGFSNVFSFGITFAPAPLIRGR